MLRSTIHRHSSAQRDAVADVFRSSHYRWTVTATGLARTYLYVPADKAERLAKATTRGADAVVIDLEDAVAPEHKEQAGANLAAWLSDVQTSTQIWVRVNNDAHLADDLNIAMHAKVTGLLLPKAEAPTQVAEVIAATHKPVAPLIESAAGLENMRDLARVSGIARLQLGEADLCADLGITLSDNGEELDAIRSTLVVTSAAAGIAPPVGPVSTNFKDLDAFELSTQRLARRGYVGRSCIHPDQVRVANTVFTPSPDDIARAQDVIQRFAQADGGVCVDAQGRMIDAAVIRQAQRVLDLASVLN